MSNSCAADVLECAGTVPSLVTGRTYEYDDARKAGQCITYALGGFPTGRNSNKLGMVMRELTGVGSGVQNGDSPGTAGKFWVL